MGVENTENLNMDHEDSSDNVDYNSIQAKLFTSVPPEEEIVISGLSGTYPNSTDVYHFQENLFNKVDMISPNRRWTYKHPEVPDRSGTIPCASKYDGGFFGVHHKQGESQDSSGRILLEKTVEAIFDAGMNLEDLEGTNTGVYVGTCTSETEQSVMVQHLGPDPKTGFTGCIRSSLAQRISYFLKLKGPSLIADTACSSSLFALESAYRDLRLGLVDTAVVGGANMTLHPFVSLQFARLGVLSHDGSCKVFDKTGNGYARAETVSVIILQKSKDAKRKYADLVYVKTNCDGYKEAGITYPSGEAQRQLMREVYSDCGISPADLSFIEAHGTGTFVGDPEESGAIDDVLAKCRTDPLLIGSVKSNLGHSEPSSGLCSITKSIIAYETGLIPPNIHFTCPRDEILGLVEKRMIVVTEKTPFKDKRGLIGINNFGFGGGNAHVLLKANPKEKINGGLPKDDIPRVICVSGRTSEALLTIFDEIKSHTLDAEYVRLLHNVFRKPILNHRCRGYSIVAKSGEIYRFTGNSPEKKPQLSFAFGELNEWFELAQCLKLIPAFAVTLEKAHKILLPKGININDALEAHESGSPKYQILGSILVQLGVIDIFKMLEIEPTNCFGFSFGELLAAHFNDILTFKQTLECACIINDVVEKVNGTCKGREINIVNNMVNNHVTSNVSSLLDQFRANFGSVESSSIKIELSANLSHILENPTNGKYKKDFKTADYFIKALVNGISNKLEHTKSNSLVLTFGSITTLDVAPDDVEVIPLVSEHEDNYLTGFLKILGILYVNGNNPQLAKLYPEVSFPVSRGTRMISPFIKWEHTRDWFVPSYDINLNSAVQYGAKSVSVELGDQKWTFVQGHVIDGRNLFPATGYLFLVWDTLCLIEDIPVNLKHIVFEDVKFLRATTVPKTGAVSFKVFLNIISGRFEIVEGGTLIVTGKVYSKDEDDATYCGVDTIAEHANSLTRKDVYKELRLRGYNYSGEFENIQTFNPSDNTGLIKWTDNWISFLDNMLQLKILTTDTRLLYVPTYINRLKLPAKPVMEWINKSYLEKQLEPILPVYINEDTSEIRCGGIVIQGLMASSIARKKDVGIPVLESHIFVPNITELELEESVRVNLQIVYENLLTKKYKCIELIDEFVTQECTLIPLVQTALGDQPLLQAIVKILAKSRPEYVPEEIEVEDKELDAETECHLVIGSKLIGRKDVLKTTTQCLKDNGFLISREDINFDSSISEVEDFTVFTVHNTPLETLVLLKKNFKTKELIAVEIDRSDDLSWIEELKDIIKSKKSDNVLIYAQNKPLSGIMGLFNCLKQEGDSSYIRCLFAFETDQHFGKDDQFYKTQLDKNMAVNIWKDNKWGTYRHLLLKNLDTVESEHCFGNITVRGDLSSLRWIESTYKYDMVVPTEKQLVYIHYASLNFRDVMTASGKINADVITQDRIEQECVQGFEFSGYTATGKRVMGLVTHGAMSTLMLGDDYLLFNVPENISLREAASLPCVYTTVLYGLINRVNMRRGSSILIHSGTGGVGQAAIRVALHYDCNIFVTVGTQEKREYLLKTFPQIKPRQIGNSRDISFETMVKKYTGGRGVDVVLNSLAEEKLQASIRCLAPGGSFVEIGKFDLANNNEINLLLMQKECSFHGVMLDQIFEAPPKIKNDISRLFEENVGKFIVPLPVTCFKYDQLVEAFRYMGSGKHMGKVMIQVREDEQPPQPVPEKFTGIPRYFCYPEKSYIIIGGLGGFGLELADWLVLRGVKNLVLVSRKGVTTGYQSLRVSLWKSYGVHVHISQDDVCTEDGCRNLLESANQLGDVHSIFNLGVVLADSVFENQTPETFKTSFGPKAVATKYLDRISREMCPKLEDFVVFSSVSCGRGNAGQTNYGMANSVMERICELRKKEGYPALAIQWGAIGDVGLVAELQTNHTQLEIGGTLQQKISNCLNVLNTLLRQNQATVVSSIVVAEKLSGAGSSDNIVDTVTNILGLTDMKVVSHHVTLPELGMDSVTGVEIKQTLEREFEIFLTPKDLKTMTLHKLKEIQQTSATPLEYNKFENFNAILFNNFNEDIEDILKEVEVPLPTKAEENGKNDTVLLFPGIDGFARTFNTLASRLTMPVVSYQYWNSVEYPSVQVLAESLLPKVENSIKKNQKFKILAYSFGSAIALEVVHLLENKGYVGEVVIIDGGPSFIKNLVQNFTLLSDSEFQTNLVLYLIGSYVPSDVILKHQEHIMKCSTWNERLDFSLGLLKENNNFSEESIAIKRYLANGMFNKTQLAMHYVQSFTKLKSKITLIVPEESIVQNIEIDRGVSNIAVNEVNIIHAKGNHVSVLETEEIGDVVNSIFNKS
ncbi:fatty acid synthase isoform X2 [Diabrotica virgifera virgifera]|nr:fatty acid synthase isoform X2 [Diabrotica virgifera virgifera]